jgi:ubiquinone/menaquinone biosynthesis C-methylase UbiE
MSLSARFFAATYDRMMGRVDDAGLREHRRTLLAGAQGRVLEIGAGTGTNLALYGASVTGLVAAEPEPQMAVRLERKAAAAGRSVEVVRAPAEDLPFEDGSFDTAVSTLVLCGVPDQGRALGEIRRVLRPGGRLLFLEHVRGDDPKTARMQDRMNWLNRLVVCCDCNRDTLASISAAGFEVGEVRHDRLPKGPPFVRPTIVGAAVRA